MQQTIKKSPLAIAILLSFSSSPLVATPGDTVGSEFLVNTETFSQQRFPSIAVDAGGDFVIVWQSSNQDGSDDGIYAQRYRGDGVAVGGEFLVNTETNFPQRSPSIALDANGDFVIVWHSQNQDGDSWGVYAQRYQANGAAVGGEFLVNTETVSHQTFPGVAMDADGDFVITWQSNVQDGSGYGVYAQRYQAGGATVGDEFLVNTETANSQQSPSVALDADGDFVIVWQSSYQDGSGFGVYAQRYQADGLATGGEFLVNTETAGFQGNPNVAMDADGDFVVAWHSIDQDGSSHGVYAQRYQADGLAVGSEFLVNTETSETQQSPDVALDADGDFVITWESLNQDGGSFGVYAQRYQADGLAVGAEFLVNTVTTSQQRNPSVVLDADGDFVIIWESLVLTGYGVYAQRYEGAGASSVDLNLVLQDDTDPVATGANFVYTLITSNNGSGIALDVNLSEPLPAGLTYVSDDSASAGWACAQAGATLNCNRAFLDVAQVSAINVTVTANIAGELSHTVTATAAQIDANSSDNSDTETTLVEDASGDTSGKGGGGGGAISGLSFLLFLPLWLRRRLR